MNKEISIPSRINNILDWIIKDKNKDNGFKYISTLLDAVLREHGVNTAGEQRKWINEWNTKTKKDCDYE